MRFTRPTLLYRDTCRRCRAISRALVCLSFGLLRRVPLRSPEVHALCEAPDLPHGKLAWIYQGRAYHGWDVLVALLSIRGKARHHAQPRDAV